MSAATSTGRRWDVVVGARCCRAPDSRRRVRLSPAMGMGRGGMRVEIRLLGEFEARVGGLPVPAVRPKVLDGNALVYREQLPPAGRRLSS